ncbi:MAG: hypothetical protein NVV72_00285 [Asticcacaulis sp.]|nr:hypothetical protein [Asticcacaulis sp.]
MKAVVSVVLGLFLLALPGAAPAETITAEQDHRNMMDQLGIQTLRPGPNGDEKAPDHANYDEARANPYPDWPDILTLDNGRKVTTVDDWWQKRRPQIAEAFEREVYGRIPANVPAVTWRTTESEAETLLGTDILASRLVGRVDNSAYPAIGVDIDAVLILPAKTKAPAPVLIMFNWGPAQFPAPKVPPAPPKDLDPRMAGFLAAAQAANLDRIHQLVADGWGVVILNPTSYQADNGAGLTQGIIGLVNKGQPRKPDDWGALRAWAWGAGQVFDYLTTRPEVDKSHIGIEGVSRYGKAALVTMAFDQRFYMGLIGSSGEGGAKPHRRNFGEAVEILDRFRRISLDGRQLPQIWRAADCRRPAGGFPRTDRPGGAATGLYLLRRARTGRRQMAGPAGQLYGDRGGRQRLEAARREGSWRRQ